MEEVFIDIENNIVKEVGEIVDLSKHLVVEGDIGVGKTTLLDKIAKEVADNYSISKVYFLSEDGIGSKKNSSKIKYLLDYNSSNEDIEKFFNKIINKKKGNIFLIIDNISHIINKCENVKNLLLELNRNKNVNIIFSIVAKLGVANNDAVFLTRKYSSYNKIIVHDIENSKNRLLEVV